MNCVANGNITQKSDVGVVYDYEASGKPYQLTSVITSTGLVSDVEQTVVYTSFEQPSSITESPYQALFTYNADGERAKMEVKQSGATIKTRWYAGSRYLKETAGGVTKEFTWIGGDAYTAPCLAVTQSGTTTYYYLLRDHLGTITHVTDASGNIVNEYNFDAWGRRRNFTDWTYTVAAQTDLLPDRGFTGHEYLPWFKLYNMNGRLYDPVVGRFLEPDPVVQDASSTQNLNRYSYCLNNPLKYTDPSGYRKRRLEPGPGEERWIDPYYHSPGGGWGPIGPGSGNYWSDAFAYSTNNFNMFTRSYLGLPLDAKMNTVTYGMRNGQAGFWFDTVTLSSQKRVGEVGSDDFRATFDVTYSHTFVASNGGAGIDDYAALGIGAVNTYTGVTGDAFYSKFHHMQKNGTIRSAKFAANNPNRIYQTSRNGVKALTKNARAIGKASGLVGSAISIGQFVYEPTYANAFDGIMGATTFIPVVGWAISGTYFIANTITTATTGQTIGEHIFGDSTVY